MKNTLLLALILSQTVAGSAWAQKTTSAPKQPAPKTSKIKLVQPVVKAKKARFYLPLTQAIKVGLKKHQDIQVAYEKIKDAELQVIENGAQGLPQLTLTASYGRQDPLLFGSTTDTSGAGGGGGLGGNAQLAAFLGLASVNSFSSRITLSQLIFTGFRVVDGVKAAQINVNLTREGLRQSQQTVAYQVTFNYFTALRNVKKVAVNKLALAQSQEQERQAKARLKAGTGVQLDVLQAQSQVIQMQQRTSEDLGEYLKSKMKLNLAMGREAEYPMELNENASVQSFDMAPENPTVLLALKNRADLKQLRMQKKMNDINATAQGRALWPTITAQAYYNLNDSQVIGGNSNSNQNMNYYLNMNWPLFDGLAASSKAQRAANTARQTQLNIDKTQQQIVVDVKQAIYDISGAYNRILMGRAGIQVAKENVRVAKISYREGIGVNMDVINANKTLLDAQHALINANFDLNMSLSRLYQTMGLDIQPYLTQKTAPVNG